MMHCLVEVTMPDVGHAQVGKRADPMTLDKSLTFEDIAGIDDAKGLVMQVRFPFLL